MTPCINTLTVTPLPVAVYMRGAECEAVVHEGGVDHDALFGPLQQVTQVCEVAVTPPHPVAGAVLVQDKHLARAEPTLKVTSIRQSFTVGKL